MIQLIAESKSDGWALALEGEQHWLLRPPYRRENLYPVTPRQVARALSEEDFDRTDEQHGDWGALVRALEQRRVKRASREDLERASHAAGLLLSRATYEQALRHIERIEQAIKDGHHSGIKDALVAILKAESVRSDDALHQRTVALLALNLSNRPALRTTAPRALWQVSDAMSVQRANDAIARNGSVLNHVDPVAA